MLNAKIALTSQGTAEYVLMPFETILFSDVVPAVLTVLTVPWQSDRHSDLLFQVPHLQRR
jgi:hypothetical protein